MYVQAKQLLLNLPLWVSRFLDIVKLPSVEAEIDNSYYPPDVTPCNTLMLLELYVPVLTLIS